MAAANFLNEALVSVDPSILSCWEEKVKQGLDCTLTYAEAQQGEGDHNPQVQRCGEES